MTGPDSSTQPQGNRPSRVSPRGLATLALLKTRYDEGKDHLSLFQPFVSSALATMGGDGLTAADVRVEIERLHGLVIPTDTVQTLLARNVRSGELRREGGRFLRTGVRIGAPDIDTARHDFEVDQQTLGDELLGYSRQFEQPFPDSNEAFHALLGFIDAHDVPLLLSDTDLAAQPTAQVQRSKQDRIIASFVTTRCLGSPTLSLALTRLLEAFVMQNALLLRDVTSPEQQFRDFLVLIDAPIAFALLGVMGQATALASREALDLLKSTGAVVQVFDKTISEMRRILAVYEQHLATAEGRLTLFPTDLTRFFLINRWSPSDIRTLAATIELQLGKLGVPVRPVPARDRRYTLDEIALSRHLSRDGEPSTEPRVLHDIDCIASVLTLRAGRGASSIERSRAAFATTSGLVIRKIQLWYREQGGTGIPPIIHQVALTNIAWLKKPAGAGKLKVSELVALCASVLRPTKRTWDAFLKNLERLRTEGTVSNDEAVAIVASELTEPLLAKIDDELDPDTDSLTDVIERVRESYKADLQAAYARDQEQSLAALAQALGRAEEATQQRAAMEAHITARASGYARTLARVLFYLGLVMVGAAVIILLPGVFDHVAGWLRTVAWISIGAFTVISLYGAIAGGHLLGICDKLERVLMEHVRAHLLGNPPKP